MSNARGWPLRLRQFGRRLRDDGGAAAVEFALVLPILVVMLFGIIEFGRAWNRQQVITDVAREAARWAVVRDGADKTATVTAIVQDRLTAAGLAWDGNVTGYEADCADWVEPSATDLTVSGCGWGAAAGTETRVLILAPYPFDLIRPLLGLLPGEGSIDEAMLSTNFVMRNE